MTTPWQEVLSQINNSKLSGGADMKLARLPVTEDPDAIRFPVGIIATGNLTPDHQGSLLDEKNQPMQGVTIRSIISDGEVYTATVSLRGMATLTKDSRVKSVSTSFRIGPVAPSLKGPF